MEWVGWSKVKSSPPPKTPPRLPSPPTKPCPQHKLTSSYCPAPTHDAPLPSKLHIPFTTLLHNGMFHTQRSTSTPTNTLPSQLDRLVGLAMLTIASAVFLYYTIWTLFMPFVDADHPLQSLFPPRVWAIRIPVILILLGSTVVGSFLSVVMIRSNRKRAAKIKAGKKA